MAAALEGLRVLDLSWGLAGALTTLVLADYGAEVAKVEPPGGDVLRSQPAFPLWGRGKLSLVLDLRSEEGRAEARRLAEQADVLVETFRPGAAVRLGLGYPEIAAVNPGLVYASITGFGSRGPWAQWKGYEGIVVAKLGGMGHVTGMAPRPGPAFPAVPYASASAAQLALQGILAALYVRERSGRGQRVETSLAQGLAAHDPWEWFQRIVAERYPEAYAPAPPVSEHGVPLSPYLFRLLVCLTKDGRWLQFSQSSPHLFQEFIDVLGLGWIYDDPDLSLAPNFDNEADAVRFWELLLNAVRERTLAEWEEVFREHPNVWAELFRTTREAMDHPQMRHNEHVTVVHDLACGRTEQLGPLVRMSRTPATIRGGAPALGRGAERVRSWLRRPPARANLGQLPRHPLEGVTVLELGLWYAAPYGPALLADLGARVIKIEPLTGEPMRHAMPVPESGAVKVLQGKQSVAVDLTQPDGREIVYRLARRADLAMMSYREGVARRLGVDYESLRRQNPRLVYLNAPGYGVDGPCAAKPAFAPTIGVAVGVGLFQAGTSIPHGADLTLDEIKPASLRLNWAAQAPGNADGCSALGVATALLLGLVARERTGDGQELLTSMLCTTSYAVSDDCLDYADKPARLVPDAMLHGFSALYRLYEASGGWVFLACPQPDEWDDLCRALRALTAGQVNLAQDPRFTAAAERARHDAALADLLATVFRTHPAGEWERLLLEYDVACAQVMPGPVAARLFGDPLVAESGLLAEVEHPLFGVHPRLAPLARLSLTPGEVGPACLLGQHTEAVLQELGYDADEIADLEERKVIGRAERSAEA